MNNKNSRVFTTRIVSCFDEKLISDAVSVSIQTDQGTEVFLAHHQDDSYQIEPGRCNIISGIKRDNEISFILSAGHALFEKNTLTITVLEAQAED